MANVVRALFTMHISPTVQLHQGDLWIADDPVVKAHPDWFSDDLSGVANRTTIAPVVETATADPGERRTTRKSDT